MLYQLRSALDACIYQGAIYVTGNDPPPDETKLEFPITDDPSEFSSLRKRRLGLFPVAVQDAIERLQPFNAPTSLPPEQMVKNMNRCLGMLHNWARKDRHRKLHVVGQRALDIDPEIIVPDGVRITDKKIMDPGPLGQDQDLVTFQLIGFKAGMVVSMNPKLLILIGLDEPPVACHQTDTLQNRIQGMLDVVNSVIIAFERYV